MTANDEAHGANSHWKEVSQNRDEILNVRAEVAKRRSMLPTAVDRIGQFLTHPWFFVTFVVAHFAWVAFNLPIWPWQPWDPYRC